MSIRFLTTAPGLVGLSVVLTNSRAAHQRRAARGFLQLVLLAALTAPGMAQPVPVQTTLRLSFPVDDLVVTQKTLATDPTGGATLLTSVALRGAGSLRQPGKPVVPCVTRRLELPAGASIAAVRATTPVGSGPVVLEGHSLLEWGQPSQRAGRDPIPPVHDLDDEGEPVFYPVDESVGLDPDVLTAVRWPDPNVWVQDSDEMAGVQVIMLNIAPLQWSPRDGRLELATELDIVVEHTGGQWPPPTTTQNFSYGEYQDFEWLLSAVANPGDVPGSGGFGDFTLPLPEELDAWYMVNTDNTNPLVADSDADGLSDGDEVNAHSTTPLDEDTGDGGRTDGDEVLVDFTDPFVGADDLDFTSQQLPGDCNQDGELDLSDAVSMLTFLFSGGPAHPLAVPGAETTGCVAMPGCPDSPHCP